MTELKYLLIHTLGENFKIIYSQDFGRFGDHSSVTPLQDKIQAISERVNEDNDNLLKVSKTLNKGIFMIHDVKICNESLMVLWEKSLNVCVTIVTSTKTNQILARTCLSKIVQNIVKDLGSKEFLGSKGINPREVFQKGDKVFGIVQKFCPNGVLLFKPPKFRSNLYKV